MKSKKQRQLARAARREAAAKKEAYRQWWLYTHVGKGMVNIDVARNILERGGDSSG